MLAAVFLMIPACSASSRASPAIIRGSFFVVLPNYAFSLSATGWGWVQLILGVIAFAPAPR